MFTALMSLLLLNSGSVYSAPLTSQECVSLDYYNGFNGTCWDDPKSTAYCGNGASILACNGNSLPVDPAETNGALEIRTTKSNGYWNFILRLGGGQAVNYNFIGGKNANLSIRIRWAQRTEDMEIRLNTESGNAGVILSSYIAPSTSWQTVNIPVADFVAANPSIDLTRVNSLHFLGIGTYPGESLMYINEVRAIPSPGCKYAEMVKINQLGYLPDMPKIFILSYETNGASPTNAAAIIFNVKNSSDGSVVYAGTCIPTTDPLGWNQSGDIVYNGDFSAVTNPGNYYITIPEFGQYSYVFKIDYDIYNDAFRDLLRFFYYARSGYAIEEPYAEAYPRQAYFAADNNAPYDYTVGTRNVQGGWFDAGDSHKDMHAQAAPMWFLLEILEDFKDKISAGVLHLPESDGEINDIYYLIKYQLDWMMKMANVDGSVHFWVDYAPNYFNQANGEVSDISSGSASVLSAIFAKAYKSFKPVPEFSGYADTLLAYATNSWNWLLANPANFNPPKPGGGNYGYENSTNEDTRMRVTAAIELYEATGDEKYNTWFKSRYIDALTDYGGNQHWAGIIGQYSHMSYVNYGYLDYIDSSQPGADAGIQSELKALFITQADWLLDKINNVPYKPGMVAKNHLFWGSNGLLAANVHSLLNAYKWTGETKYKNAACENVHWLCGRNPVGYCMISGNGSKKTDFYSFYWLDFNFQPPGYLTGGINQGELTEFIPYKWKRYMNIQLAGILEPWLGWNAEAAYALGYFSTLITYTPPVITPEEEMPSSIIMKILNNKINCADEDDRTVNFYFEIPEGSLNVKINIYDISGELIKALVNRDYKQGIYTESWNPCDDVGRGVYLAIFEIAKYKNIYKIMVIK